MPCLGRARLISGLWTVSVSPSLRRPRSSLRSLYSYALSSIARSVPRRAFSTIPHSPDNLFDYTSGRWIINDALRHAERRRVFNVDGLCRLAAQSVDRSPDDIIDLTKLAEGGFNRTFLITMRDGFQMVARIPYPATVPKELAVASEAATMALLRSSGLPVPEVYGYSPVPDNAAETEYIFMEFVIGTTLSDVWFDLEEEEIVPVMRQLVELESKMMSISFPAGGSLYYAQDLEKLVGTPGIPLEDKRFYVGPDTRLPLWSGRRSQLDVDRGPYENVEAALAAPAYKELAYLKQFGRPLLPFERMRREAYRYQEQPPSDHIENLNRYLLIAPSLIPKNPVLGRFCIRHPDLQSGNIIVSRSPDSTWRIVSLLDWQHAPILPLFLLAGLPERFENFGDPISQSMARPSLPEDFDDLHGSEQSTAKEIYRRRLVHHHYIKDTEEHNELHYTALLDPMGNLRRRLFCHASDPWEGETLALKVDLIEATETWETLTGGGAPCPVVFDADDVRKTMQLDEAQRGADETLEACRNIIRFGTEGWVSTERYEEAMARSKQLKEAVLAVARSVEERTEMAAHWPLDDMDEEIYT
ncbi:protein kinase subdomain-containing protein PKL/CAK/Fmp29 [Dichomitus squalens LYAD-421 SS1]|uniref:protein kinase subdomain-containing protein PKL/CAK/Fmp29 n=1 Tax=Dichomitus squalens (strain LYAD-421) TaxID=732165 RepID=UPI00044120D1|nr:protein kinase subdomain-containing protein PKL/CAK/Fmp29 [Dichomitus squalens LYAD-421 SS1]EJF63622.1 protein kinase subdomain-containing protein PKL/CAK/Fmp29 [Dichomitus squalens LYAD-421 SS1]